MIEGSGGEETREAAVRRAELRRLLKARATTSVGARLSAQQERLWVAHHLNPGDPSHNLRTAVWIRGPLDIGQLETAMTRLVHRHALLRARFRELDGRPYVDIATDVTVHARRVDLSGSGSGLGGWDSPVAKEIRAEAALPFQLEAGPPIRLALLRLDEAEHVAVVTIHHIVSDAWSMELMLRELCELYDAALTRRTPVLPDLHATYQDFTDSQPDAIDGVVGDEMKAFWRRELDGYSGDLSLPFDGEAPDPARVASAHMVSRRLSRVFTTDLSRRVDEAPRLHRATAFMVILAAIGMLLRRLGGGTDLIVATPVANRQEEAWEGLVGYFVNLLPLRIRMDHVDTFVAVISRLRGTVLEAYEYQQLPLHRVAEAADLRPAHLLRVLYQHAAAPATRLEGGGASFAPEPIDLGISHHELSVATHLTGDRLTATLEYRQDLFSTEAAERFLGDLESALEQVTTNPSCHAADLIVSEAWRLQDDRQAITQESSSLASQAVKEPPTGEREAELSPTESAMVEVWHEVLGLESVSPFDNFLDVGGDSLLAMQVIERVERAIGVRVSPADLFVQTLAQLAASCDTRRA